MKVACPITGQEAEVYAGTHSQRAPVDADCLLPDVGWVRVYMEVVVPRQPRMTPVNWNDPQLREQFREIVTKSARLNHITLTEDEIGAAMNNLVFQAQTGYGIGKAVKEADDSDRRELLRVVFPPASPEVARKVLATLSDIGFVLPPELES